MIPSLLQIPSAVSDSKLHSVLPNNGKGDFQFDRSTGATRINRDGLIEEVGYFSSELVQNGNFSELGSEALINGDFATDSDWTKGTGWVIMNGYAESDGTNAPLDQVSRLTIGKTYKVVITVTNMTSSALSVRLGTSSSNAVLSILENGTYTAYGVAGATTFRLRSQGFDGRIQNVSVKQVDPNDRWTVTSADSNNFVEFTQGQARLKFLNTSPITTLAATAPYKGGKTYKLIVDVASVTSGSIKVDASGISETFNTAGVTTRIVSPTGNGNINFYRATSNVDITLNSVSLVEVQGDRPRLSYDITNGVVEDKPHLLLEPSSTNLVTFSEDLSDWTLVNGTLTSNATVSPDGTQNADKVVFGNGGLDFKKTITVVAGQTYTLSFYIKLESGTGLQGRFYDNSNSANIEYYTYTSQISGTEWSRVTRSVTAPSGCTQMQIWLLAASSSAVTASFWGAQFEQQSYATSYIPTAGTTITRAAETCNNSKPSVNSTEGVLYCEIAALADDLTNRIISISDGTSNNRVLILYQVVSNKIRGQFSVSGQSSKTIDHIAATTQFRKIAFSWNSTSVKLYIDGQEIGETTTGFTFSANVLNEVAFDNVSGGEFYGKVKGLAVYNEALSESQLMQLTGVTASSIYNNFVTRTASFTVEALNEVKKVIDNL
jgi:hypothetical protein